MDRDLVEAARQGDPEAYMDVIRPRVDGPYAIAQRILRDADRAEDAVQDALVIAWRDLRALRDPDRIDAWLRRVLVNVCVAQATRERRLTVKLRELVIDRSPAPDELLTLQDRDQLERGFRRLPPGQRMILVLHHFVGFPPAEAFARAGGRDGLHDAGFADPWPAMQCGAVAFRVDGPTRVKSQHVVSHLAS